MPCDWRLDVGRSWWEENVKQTYSESQKISGSYHRWHVILHVRTNGASSCNSSEIVNKLKLRLPISQKLQNAKPIRSDTAAGKVTIEKVNKQLNDFDFDMIDNSNLSRAHLNGRGLHLNTKGMLQFAKNLIEGIRKLWNKKKLADQNVDLSKSHTPYDHHSRISPVVDNILIHDSNIIIL